MNPTSIILSTIDEISLLTQAFPVLSMEPEPEEGGEICKLAPSGSVVGASMVVVVVLDDVAAVLKKQTHVSTVYGGTLTFSIILSN